MPLPDSRFVLRLLISLVLFVFFVNCRNKISPAQNNQTGSVAKIVPTNNRTLQPQVEVLVDEAILKKPFAIIGGTVHNITAETLPNLKIDIELKRRSDESTAIRELSVIPSNLGPGERGHYSLQVLSDEWGGSKLLRVRTDNALDSLTFKALPGAQRPPERPAPMVHVIKVPRAKTKSRQEEFINTPDTPVRIP